MTRYTPNDCTARHVTVYKWSKRFLLPLSTLKYSDSIIRTKLLILHNQIFNKHHKVIEYASQDYRRLQNLHHNIPRFEYTSKYIKYIFRSTEHKAKSFSNNETFKHVNSTCYKYSWQVWIVGKFPNNNMWKYVICSIRRQWAVV